MYFRVYLDRRKIKQDDQESPPTELVRELVAEKLTADPDSVHTEGWLFSAIIAFKEMSLFIILLISFIKIFFFVMLTK